MGTPRGASVIVLALACTARVDPPDGVEASTYLRAMCRALCAKNVECGHHDAVEEAQCFDTCQEVGGDQLDGPCGEELNELNWCRVDHVPCALWPEGLGPPNACVQLDREMFECFEKANGGQGPRAGWLGKQVLERLRE